MPAAPGAQRGVSTTPTPAKINPMLNPTATRIIDFLQQIGLTIRLAPLAADTFLPGVTLEPGGLIVDSERLLYPGDLLHEAGHLATMLPAQRSTAGSNAGSNMGDEIAAQTLVLRRRHPHRTPTGNGLPPNRLQGLRPKPHPDLPRRQRRRPPAPMDGPDPRPNPRRRTLHPSLPAHASLAARRKALQPSYRLYFLISPRTASLYCFPLLKRVPLCNSSW